MPTKEDFAYDSPYDNLDENKVPEPFARMEDMNWAMEAFSSETIISAIEECDYDMEAAIDDISCPLLETAHQTRR